MSRHPAKALSARLLPHQRQHPRLQISPSTVIFVYLERSYTMSSRIHTHSPLPAPALHASTAVVQSKSHVLAGVQDAYWSDDEAVCIVLTS